VRNSTKSRIWKKQRQGKEQEKGISRRGDMNTKYFHAVASKGGKQPYFLQMAQMGL
jgi:hypothetical protein